MLLQLSKTVKQSPKSPQIFENNGAFCADRPFSKNRSETNCQKSFVFNQLVSELQSYILSTTTETKSSVHYLNLLKSFNRTSFQQQLKLVHLALIHRLGQASIVHPFNNNWNSNAVFTSLHFVVLQSYILSTTTETRFTEAILANLGMLQSYILSTTTETYCRNRKHRFRFRFNRTSFQQQLKHRRLDRIASWIVRFNRTSFQQQLKQTVFSLIMTTSVCFNRTSFQQQLKLQALFLGMYKRRASIVHPFNNNWNVTYAITRLHIISASIVHPFNNNWNSELFLQGTYFQASIVHPFNNNWNNE